MSYSVMHQRYGNHLSTRNVRRVWAAITATPYASQRELAQALRISHGAVSSALRLLKDAGYIQFPKCASRAVEVLVPFVVQELE
jgi:DNA-binding transcriptional MocR family regulator